MNDLIKFLDDEYQISFKNAELLKEAFTHGTYLHDVLQEDGSDYQRLEFLGDSVMQLMVADFLFNNYKNWSEGELTEARISMVQSKSFSHFARLAKFNNYILLSDSAQKQGFANRDNILEDIFESFIGALYIDQGELAVKSFLNQTIFKAFKEGYFDQFVNYKSKLQELLQRAGKVDIEYEVTSRDESNPADPSFTVELLVNGVKLSENTANSIKKAETIAAQIAFQELNKNEA